MQLRAAPSPRLCTPSRLPARLLRDAGSLEPLEPRQLLSTAFTYQSIADRFDLPDILHAIAPPTGQVANFGAAGAVLGDIDGDGAQDFAISAPGSFDEFGSTVIPGSVFLYSGRTGQLIRGLSDGSAGFGASLAPMWDYNSDAMPDLAIGSPNLDDNRNAIIDPVGMVYIYSGADGQSLRQFRGYQAHGEFGRSIAAAGYLSPDSRQELLVGAPNDGPDHQGRAYVLTSEDVLPGVVGAEIIYTFTGQATGDRFGAAVAAADLSSPVILPLTGRGLIPIVPIPPDYLIGAPVADQGAQNSGSVYIYNHQDGSLNHAFHGLVADGQFGVAVAAIRHLTTVEVLVGAPGETLVSTGTPLDSAGAVHRFQVDDTFSPLGVLLGRSAGDRFGSFIGAPGDVNGDGFADLAVGSQGLEAPGFSRLFSGADLAEFTLDQDNAGLAGPLAFGLGDPDSDGIEDVLFVSPAGMASPAAALVVSSVALVPPVLLSGGNDSGSFLYFNSVLRYPAPHEFQRDRYALINGVYTPLYSIPGMEAGGVILGVNDSHLIVGAYELTNQIGGNIPLLTGLFLVRSGIRTQLSDAVTQVIGGQTPDYNNFNLIKVANDGSILFAESSPLAILPRVWLFKDGVLTFLWNGAAIDINSTGSVIGSIAGPAGPRFVIRSPGGATATVTGLTQLGKIADDGAIYGLSNADTLAVWRTGVVTTLAALTPILGGGFNSITGVAFRDTDAAGRIILNIAYLAGRSELAMDAMYVPGSGLLRLADLVFGPGAPAPSGRAGEAIQFGPSGSILNGIGFLDALAKSEPWTLAEGSPLASAGSVVIGVNTLGDVVALRRTGSDWSGSRIALPGFNRNLRVDDILAYVDPTSGDLYTVILAEGTMYWALITGEPTIGVTVLSGGPASTSIVANASVFTTADRRVVLTGTDPSGDLIIYYQNRNWDPGSPFNWDYDNLVDTHLTPSGQTFVPVASRTAGFGTAWNANNIAYTDAQGHVQVVWSVPGSGWSIQDLSATAGAPTIRGPLSAFTTAWNALNIIGTASDGDEGEGGAPVAIWWVPGGGGWRYNRLDTGTASIAFDPASITAYVTPWNAMNIVGRDVSTGTTAAYWWSPESNRWTAEPLRLNTTPPGFSPLTTGRFTSSITGSTQNLFARSQTDGHLLRFSWSPGDADIWRMQDVTMAV